MSAVLTFFFRHISYIEANIFKSIENVNLDTVIGYKKDGARHSFLEEY